MLIETKSNVYTVFLSNLPKGIIEVFCFHSLKCERCEYETVPGSNFMVAVNIALP